MTALLADIGGTHARIAQEDVVAPAKYAVTDFANPAELFDRYCAEKGLERGGSVRIATAANPGADGRYHFTNNPDFVLDPEALQAQGWAVQTLADDFVAAAYGVAALTEAQRIVLKQAAGMAGAPRALLGPGTGLGLAYMIPLQGGWHVQQTFGGHMLAAGVTAEQQDILIQVAKIKGNETIPVPEDVASGRGLPLLYEAVCRQAGVTPALKTAAALLDNAGDALVLATLRLFHEFLGLFAHHAVVTGHAYGGLYLDGGVIHALRRAGLFDFAAFERFLLIPAVPVGRDAVAATPVWLVDDPYIALRGLMGMGDEG